MAGNSVLIMPAQLVTHQNTVDMSERFGLNDTRQEKSSRTKTGCWDLPGKKRQYWALVHVLQIFLATLTYSGFINWLRWCDLWLTGCKGVEASTVL